MFRSPLEIEVLAEAHRNDLLPRSRWTRGVGTPRASGPLAWTRRAVGLRLIALGERLAARPRTGYPLSPAGSTAALGATGSRAR